AGQVRIAFGLDVTREEAEGSPAHPAVHGGGHHITQHAPALDELRDRLTGPGPGLLRRIRQSIGARLLRRCPGPPGPRAGRRQGLPCRATVPGVELMPAAVAPGSRRSRAWARVTPRSAQDPSRAVAGRAGP